jgi:outer membrane protein assembly factor BamB
MHRNRFVTLLLPILFAAVLPSDPCRAENWPRWRGPSGNAVSSETPLPIRWSTTENVRWKVRIDGEGSSSPIVWNDRVFITSAINQGTRRVLHCLDRLSGKTLWTRQLDDENPELTSALTGHAAATPVTDGTHVVVLFGNAGAACFDFTGQQLWRRRFGEFDSELGLASSPIIHGGNVILVCDHDGNRFRTFDSFIIALDVKTGDERWKTDRRGLFRSWSTPIVVPAADGNEELIVNAQDELRGYDPQTGRQLWNVRGMTGWVTPSPVFGMGMIFATSGKDGPAMAVKPGGRDDVTQSHVAWLHERGAPYVCSPLLYGQHLYVHNELGILTCYRAASGEVAYRERLPGKFTASAVAGDGIIFFTNESGDTYVVPAGPVFQTLATNRLEEECLASPAISGGCLFMRTEHHLYCIGPVAKP